MSNGEKLNAVRDGKVIANSSRAISLCAMHIRMEKKAEESKTTLLCAPALSTYMLIRRNFFQSVSLRMGRKTPKTSTVPSMEVRFGRDNGGFP